MIVTTGRIVRIEVHGYTIERTSETPGIATITQKGGHAITLPANEGEMERLIAAYRRACNEDVGYRKSEVE